MDFKRAIANRVKEISNIPDWYKGSFPSQKAFIEDPALLKAAYCTRRAGKSYGCGIYMCKEAYENPGVSILYIALTRMSAGRIMWKDVLRVINRDMKLNAKFNEAELKMTFPNGSVIYLEGADSSQDAMDKFLGQKFKLVILDEAAKFKNSVKKLVFDILKPALADYEGTVAMIGTTNNFVKSYFAQVTQGQIKGWTVHRWMASDNPHMKRQFALDIKRLKEDNPNVVNEPWFQQNYEAKWVVDSRDLLYKYSDDVKIPDIRLKRMSYSLGISLSNEGLPAYSVVAYSEDSREAYVVETLKPNIEFNTYAVNNIVEKLKETWDIHSIHCDGLPAKLIEELNSRLGLEITDVGSMKDIVAIKRMFISDLSAGYVKVLPGNQDLLNEWDSIILESKRNASMLREHILCETYLANATVYAWAQCYNYSYSPEEISDDPIDKEWDRIRDNLEQGEDEYIDEQDKPFYDIP